MIGIDIALTDYILMLLACHFLGYFAFQSYFIAKGKSDWELNFYHAATYTAPFVLFLPDDIRLSLVSVGILFVSHFFIDPLSARWGIIKKTWQDQILHFIILIIVVIIECQGSFVFEITFF